MHAHVKPLIRVGGYGDMKRWMGQMFYFFSPVFPGEVGEGAAPWCQTMSAAGDGGWSFDDSVEPLYGEECSECDT